MTIYLFNALSLPAFTPVTPRETTLRSGSHLSPAGFLSSPTGVTPTLSLAYSRSRIFCVSRSRLGWLIPEEGPGLDVGASGQRVNSFCEASSPAGEAITGIALSVVSAPCVFPVYVTSGPWTPLNPCLSTTHQEGA